MIDHLLPVLFCLMLWWLGTGIVLRLDSMPENTHRTSAVLLSVVAIMAMLVIWRLSQSTTVLSAYASFASAIVLWGWLEFLHYSGVLVGPNRKSCPVGIKTSRRFFLALGAMLYHELAVALMALALFWLLLGSENQTAFYTYMILWVMRVSAELNVFFGVAYLPEEWLPKKLQYLMSYRKIQRINAFFPVSVTVATIACVWMFYQMPAKSVDAFNQASVALTATLLLLAIIEHWLLVLPAKGIALWAWAQQRSV